MINTEHNNLIKLLQKGNELMKLRQFQEAEECYRHILDINPKFIDAQNNLAILLKQLNRFEEAKEYFKNTILIKPDYFLAHNNLGNTLKELNKFEEAIVSYKKAINLEPNYLIAHFNLGILYKELGNFKESIECFNKALLIKPDYVEALRSLSSVKKFQKNDITIINMEKLYSSNLLKIDQSCILNFALGKAYEDIKEYSKSFEHYSAGNIKRKKLLNYNIDEDMNLFKKLRSIDSDMKNTLNFKYTNLEDFRPIFILGMPRSGTTLVEQIISSHSEVEGAGELNDISIFGKDIVSGRIAINSDNFIKFRNYYINKVKKLSKKKKYFTDKMPLNFRYIGLIFSIFPNAKIIHVERNIAATCWGNFKQFFINNDLNYSYDLKDILKYYKLYQNLMVFWKKTFGDKIFDLNYDRLTENQKKETVKIIDYLNLSWDEKCLSPEKNKRIISTSSNTQIRNKIYKGSSLNWKNFEPYIGDVFKNLN